MGGAVAIGNSVVVGGAVVGTALVVSVTVVIAISGSYQIRVVIFSGLFASSDY